MAKLNKHVLVDCETLSRKERMINKHHQLIGYLRATWESRQGLSSTQIAELLDIFDKESL